MIIFATKADTFRVLKTQKHLCKLGSDQRSYTWVHEYALVLKKKGVKFNLEKENCGFAIVLKKGTWRQL